MKTIFTMITACLLLSSCRKDTNSNEVTTNNNPQEGKIYLAPFTPGESTGQLLVMDKNGTTLQEIGTPGIAINFKQWNINGTVRYTYLVEDHTGYHIPGFAGSIPGYVVIADENLNEIKRVYLSSFGNIDASTQNLLDSHDFILLSDDHYIAMTYYKKTVTNIPDSLNPVPGGVTVAAPVIQEVENDQVIWQWDGTDHPELYAESVEGNNFSSSTAVNDYLHLNSTTIDPNDNNLVCSFRNANLIIKINRSTGDIMWKLGGHHSDFPIGENEVFLRQHHATFADNGSTLLIFDNGEATERPYSRILEFKLNESTMQVENFKAYNIPESFTGFMGSVQKNGDTYFIGGGTANYVLEVNYVTGNKTFEMHLAKGSYRAFKY